MADSNTIDLYDPRVMLQALEQKPPVRTFLLDTFFKNTRMSTETKIDLDIWKGKRRVAVYVSPVEEGHIVKHDGKFATRSYEAPYIKEKIPTKAGDLLKRLRGEPVYGGSSPLQRAAKLFADEATELDEMVTRAEEIQAAQGLFTGHVIVNDENGHAKDDIDFGLSATHNLTAATVPSLWTADGFKKNAFLAQLRGYRKTLIKDSGFQPTDIILGSDAADQAMVILDPDSNGSPVSNFRITRGQIDPQNLPNGVTYWGYITELGCDVWSYDEYYWSGSDNLPIVPAKKMWMGSRNARYDRNYGAIQDMDSLLAVPRFPKSWITPDPSVRWLMLQSAPLMAPHQVDAFLVAQVLA
jgi:hypothetical protein